MGATGLARSARAGLANFGYAGTGMTIKLVLMAVMYGVVVLGPRFFPRVKAEPAQRG
jgi:hypothetical protein